MSLLCWDGGGGEALKTVVCFSAKMVAIRIFGKYESPKDAFFAKIQESQLPLYHAYYHTWWIPNYPFATLIILPGGFPITPFAMPIILPGRFRIIPLRHAYYHTWQISNYPPLPCLLSYLADSQLPSLPCLLSYLADSQLPLCHVYYHIGRIPNYPLCHDYYHTWQIPNYPLCHAYYYTWRIPSYPFCHAYYHTHYSHYQRIEKFINWISSVHSKEIQSGGSIHCHVILLKCTEKM